MNDKAKKIITRHEPYWIASTQETNYSALNEDINVDVAIIGGGITGILCAYLLSTKGVKSTILEADRILKGTTGHTTAKITSQHGLIYSKLKSQLSEELARQYAEANEAAIGMFKRIAEENNISCDLISQAAYVYTSQDEYIEKISKEADAAASLGIKAALIDELPLNFPIKAAVRFDNQAQFHPLKFLLPLAGIITSKGCQIFEQTRIVDIEEGINQVLTTDKGNKITAKKVIIASHYPFYNKPGLYFTRIYTERSYVVAIKASEKYPGGMYITANEDPGRSIRSQMSDDGELILVGGEHHKTGQGEDTEMHYEALVNYAHENFEVKEIPYRWSTQDCMTLDNIPYTGHFTSKTPDIYIATGFGKWGMTNSMVSAMILSELLTDNVSPWQDVYDPSRQTIMASAKNFVVENLNVAEKLIEGKVSPIPEDVEIKPGEGKIIKVDGQRAGAYRDEKGKLHVVNTTCTHMGCELYWNSAEKSWDCPCHGSRFSYEGDIIEGPAVKPLEMHSDVNTIEKLMKDEY